MLFKKRSARARIPFERPRAATVDLNVALLPAGLVWLPKNAWEAADTDYFAATAAPLQTQTLRGPTGVVPSKNRHDPQVPNIAGRWVLKLNRDQNARSGPGNEVNNGPGYLGWAETHAHYTTFVRAELVISLDDSPAPSIRELHGRAISELIAAHCVMLQSTGTLRIIPASTREEAQLTAMFPPSESISHQRLREIGRFATDPRLVSCPQKTVIDIVPAIWCESAEGKSLAQSLGWLVKRAKRESQLRQR